MAASLGVSQTNEFSWKGAAIQRGLEQGSRGIAIVGVVTRQLPVKTQQNEKSMRCSD
jgi:hypothetical protein